MNSRREEIVRIEKYLQVSRDIVEKSSSASKSFRFDYHVDINMSIEDVIFFDNGRMKNYSDFSDHRDSLIDAIFDTLVSDPINEKNDAELHELIRHVKKIMGGSQTKVGTAKSIERMKETTVTLISEVIDFYGGLDLKNIDPKFDKRIETLRKKNNTNLVYLGQVKGCGMCRQRSILFKLLCDILRVPCRILRGWISWEGRNVPHMWNEVVLYDFESLEQETLIVDCTNFKGFAPLEFVGSYIPLSVPNNEKKKEEELEVEDIKEKIGQGGLSKLFIMQDFGTNGSTKVSLQLSDKVNAAKFIQLKPGNLVSPQRSLYLIEYTCDARNDYIMRENIFVHRMCKLLRHPNVIEIRGIQSNIHSGRGLSWSVIVDNHYLPCSLVKEEIWDSKIENQNVSDLLKRAVESLIILLEVAQGLKHIHSFGLVHLDISSTNILVGWDPTEQIVEHVSIGGFDRMMSILDIGAAPPANLDPKIGPLVEVEGVQPSVDVLHYGKFMSTFRDCYEGYPRLHKLEKKCLSIDPNERPSVDEIIHAIKSTLIDIKSEQYRKLRLFEGKKQTTFFELLMKQDPKVAATKGPVSPQPEDYENVKEALKELQEQLSGELKEKIALKKEKETLEGRISYLESTTDIDSFLKTHDLEDFLHLDASFHFCQKGFVDFFQRIHNVLFHEKRGHELEYMNFIFRRVEVDRHSETTLWDPKKDAIIRRLITQVHTMLEGKWKTCFHQSKSLAEHVIPSSFKVIIGAIMKIVSKFFGGHMDPRLEDNCDRFVEEFLSKVDQQRRNRVDGISTTLALSK